MMMIGLIERNLMSFSWFPVIRFAENTGKVGGSFHLANYLSFVPIAILLPHSKSFSQNAQISNASVAI
jgi:hypothetical protein